MSEPETHRPIIVLLGPTAGGKTSLSLDLAEHLPGGGEVISADSMQIYRHMDIGTAKPSVEERRGVPHHLLDMVEPDEPFTVDDWRKSAEEVIVEIRSRGRWPIVVGGTNLYIRVLLEGMFDGPPADPVLRDLLSPIPSDQLHERLQQVDPTAAKQIHVNDRKRLIRAIEVYEQTGQPISQWQQQWNDENNDRQRQDALIIGLHWETELINERINARVKLMIEQGLVDEVRSLVESGRLGQQAREALGYKQILAHFDGKCSLDDAIERIKIETRRFARKQRTWLKRFRIYERSIWLDAGVMTAQALLEQSLRHCIDQDESGTGLT